MNDWNRNYYCTIKDMKSFCNITPKKELGLLHILKNIRYLDKDFSEISKVFREYEENLRE